MKRVLSLLLTLLLLFSLLPSTLAFASAEETVAEEVEKEAHFANSDVEAWSPDACFYISEDAAGIFMMDYEYYPHETEYRNYLTQEAVSQIAYLDGILYYNATDEHTIKALDLRQNNVDVLAAANGNITRFAITSSTVYYLSDNTIFSVDRISGKQAVLIALPIIRRFWLTSATTIEYIADVEETIAVFDVSTGDTTQRENLISQIDLESPSVAETGKRGLSLTSLKSKFPHGKYWNHVGGTNNPNGYTSSPCSCHGNCNYYGYCNCNSFSNAIQCMGYALKVGYDYYGSDPRNWSTVYNLNSLKAGDYIRYKGNRHSIWVTGVNGDTITYTDCNSTGRCQIRWEATISKSTVAASLTHVKVAPGTAASSTPAAPSAPSVSVSGSSVTVSWNNVADETGYDVYLVQSPWAWADIKYHVSVGADVCSHTFSGVSAGHYCAFVISRPNDDQKQSGWTALDVTNDTPPNISWWMSDTKMGSVTSSFLQGNRYYFCYNLTGKTSGKLLDSIGNYSYTVTETITRPDGTTVSFSYNNDNNWISLKCTQAGTYRYSIKLSGDFIFETSGSIYVRENPPTLTTSTNPVTWDLSAGSSRQILIQTGGYLPTNLFIQAETISGNIQHHLDSFSGNSIFCTLSATEPGSGVIKFSLIDLDTDKTIATLSVNAAATLKSYSVSYNANGGSNAPSSQTKYHGKDLVLTTSTPAGKRYTVTFNGNGGTVGKSSQVYSQSFKEWNTSASGSGTKYASGGSYSSNSSVTLYAVWENPLFSDNTATKSGSYFLGWYDSPEMDNETHYPLGKKYLPGETEITGSVTLYALWSSTPIRLFGDYNMDGVIDFYDMVGLNNIRLGTAEATEEDQFWLDVNVDGTIDMDDIELINKVRLGTANYSDLPVVDSDIVFTAISMPKTTYQYGEEFVSTGLAIESYCSRNSMVSYVISKGFSIEGYDPYTIGNQYITIRYYQYDARIRVLVEAPQFALYLDENYPGGNESRKTVTYKSAVGSLPTPTRSGYRSTGWYTAKSGGTLYTASTIFSQLSDIRLYARWTADCSNGNHDYESADVAPTCNAHGYVMHTCKNCGDISITDYVNPLGHSYTYTLGISPTESSGGTIIGRCSRCGDEKSIALPALNKSNYSYTVTSASTCVAAGNAVYKYSSSTYGTYSFSVTLPLAAHNYKAITTEPTCTADGSTQYTCTNCSANYTVILTATGHVYDEIITQPTCTSQGYTTFKCISCADSYKSALISALGHNYAYAVTTTPTTSASGVLTGTCSRCSTNTTVTLPKLNATDYTYTVVTAATCTANGTGRYTWKTTTYGTFKFDVSIPKTDHSYTYAVTTAPTTSTTGELTGTCSKCGGTTTVTLPKLNTTDYNYSVTKAATCTATGTGRYTWKTTTYGTFYFDVTIPKTAHSYTTTVTQPACTAQGYTTHTCSVCGYSYKDSYTNALGHSWDAGTVTLEPTETEPGVKTFTCTRCGETKTEPIPATGHTHNYTATVVASTCTERGYTIHACACGDSYIDAYTAALGHAWDAGVVTTKPTETTTGIMTYTCTRCGATRTESIPELGHKHQYTETVTAPTCTEKGYTTHTCSCGESYVDSYVDALGHAWDNGKVTTQPTETTAGVKTFTCTRCSKTKTESIPATGGQPDQPDQPCDGGEGCSSGKFVDVSARDWFHEAVDFAVEQGLFGGMSANTFEPETAMTRAMLVTVLWRYEGEPDAPANTFSDVKSGTWYSNAVSWAAANGVVNGVGNNKFDPEGKITREQMATILFRYAQKKGIDTSKRGNLGDFPDVNRVSSYAKDAVQWAVGEKIINGSDGKLLPQGSATRAQVATILMRFIENIVNK